MDSLILTFLSVFLAEIGDRPQILAAALALRYRNERAVLAGLFCASFANCGLSAFAGSAVNQWISEDPVRLFRAIAYVLAGGAMLGWRQKVDLLQNWKLGAFTTAFLGLFILQFGDKGQFIIAANAASASHWLFTAAGGFMAIMAAVAPAIYFKDRLATLVPLKTIRLAGAVALLLYGLWLGLGALRIL